MLYSLISVNQAHRGHSTATVYAAADVTSMDVDLGVALRDASQGVVLSYFDRIRGFGIRGRGLGSRNHEGFPTIFVGTAACAIHVAAIREFRGLPRCVIR